MAQYRRTFSPGQKKVSVANEVIDFWINDITPTRNCDVQFLQIQTFAQPIRIKINHEETIHWIDANSEFTISEIDVDKITILDGGVEFYYTAMSVE